jgi:hypothetical protein
MENYWQAYRSGGGGDLGVGLKQVDSDIHGQLSLNAGR